MTRLSIRIPEEDSAAIDQLVKDGRYTTRSAVVSHAIRELLRTEHEREVAERYRRAYAEQPFDHSGDESWVIGVGQHSLHAQQ